MIALREMPPGPAQDILIEESGFLECFSAPVVPKAKVFAFAPEEFIIREYTTPKYLYYMAAGRAKLYTTLPGGQVALIDFFKAPCFIGEMELIGVPQAPCAVQAIKPCTCIALPVAACKQALLQDAVFLRHICLYLGTKNAKNIALFTRNQTFPLKNRLAAFILLTSIAGRYAEKHVHAADYLGVSYRHLLYVLAEFVQEGLLAKEKDGYHITNPAALWALARVVDPELESTLGQKE